MKEKIIKGLYMFKHALYAIKYEILISLLILVTATIVFTMTMFLAEHPNNPQFTIWKALSWTVATYIKDSGGIFFAPTTTVGKIVGVIVGLIGIAIYAVPAGLLGTGLMKAIVEEKKEEKLRDTRERMKKSFRRQLDKKTRYRVTTRRIPVITLQAKKGIAENDIIDTVMKFKEFRLRNLATSQSAAEHPQDRLVIEMLPLDQLTVDGFGIEHTNYGIKIDRGSLVTIIAPTAATENSIGHFAYYLAQFGGFNYVSREFISDVDEPTSYYIIDGEESGWEKPLKAYIDDIKKLSAAKEKWNVILVSADNIHDTQFHFIHRANEKSGLTFTTLDEEKFTDLYTDMAEKMQKEFDYLSDLDEKYRPVDKKNVGMITGGGTMNNTFTLRISYSVTTWSDTPVPIIVEMAKVLKRHLEKLERSQFEENPSWKEKGYGYGENPQPADDRGQ